MLRTKLISTAGCLLIFAASLLTGCSGDGGGGGSSSSTDPAATTQAITTKSATGDLQATIGGVTINSPPVVTFALSDEDGNPLDPTTSGLNIRFSIARLDDSGNYKNYIASAAGQPTTDSTTGAADRFKVIRPGVYQYTFATDITDPTKTMGNLAYDQTKTHTVAMQIYRTITRNGKSFTQILNPYHNFRPDGASVTVVRELTPTSACIKCHGKLGFHGESSRQEVAFCIMCHHPGATDPQTGNSIDMKDMVHRIHMGQALPSVQGGASYAIIGYNSSFHDYSNVKYPVSSTDAKANNVPMDCSKCHTAGTDALGREYNKANSTAWQTASKANCTTCHDTTTFDGSSTVTVNNPVTGQTAPATISIAAVQHTSTTDANCAICHAKSVAEYDRSVTGAHTVWEKSTTNTGMIAKVLSASNVGYGLAPKVRIQVTNGKGVGIAPGTASNTITVYASLKPKGVPDFFNTTTLTSGNPQANVTATTATNATAVDASRGIYDVDFGATVLPTQAALAAVNTDPTIFAQGATVMFSITAYRTDVTLTRTAGSTPTANPQIKADMLLTSYYDLATGQPSSDVRRTVIDENKCKNCHTVFTIHSSGRGNANSCTICHTPTRDDENFAFLIHKWHRGENQAANKFRRYTESNTIIYPTDIMRCDSCHISNNPEPVVSFPAYSRTDVTAPRLSNAFPNAAIATGRIPSVSASCVSCHDSDAAMSHAMEMATITNTYPYYTENCTSCHSSAARAIYHQLPR